MWERHLAAITEHFESDHNAGIGQKRDYKNKTGFKILDFI